MKKLFTILAMLAITTSAMADSVTFENQSLNNVTGNDQNMYLIAVRHSFTNSIAGDVVFSNVQTENTNALSTRLEGGVTASTPLFGSVKGYVRTAIGQKYTNTKDYQYYSIEPGLSAPVGPFTVKVGYRHRDATDNAVNKTENTQTWRSTVSYALSKKHSISVGYDRTRGDSDQKITKVGYTYEF